MHVLSKTLFVHLPDEIIRIIHSFVIWDVTSMSFAVHISKKPVKQFIHSWLLTTMNRKNGFRGQQEPDTEDEHWALGNGLHRCLQAINCKRCGNYKFASMILLTPLHPSLRCHCLP